ncbi:Lipase [Mycena kentingensis (nom. inval.)]|nr:Lipase [Mycena kentingensis (nom. inval.)]
MLSLAFVLGLASFAAAAPSLVARQSVSALSAAQVTAFKPYSFYASSAYCSPASTLAWNCGPNCAANPTFITVASGGDGAAVQFWYVGYDSKLATVIVGHQGTDPDEILPIVTDVNFGLKGLDSTLFPGVSSSVQAHSGFLDSHARAAPRVLAAVRTAISRFSATKVTLVGHSLGGALALLDALYLSRQLTGVTLRTVTYGMPRVGNQAFADLLSAGNTITHINNKDDLIPILPGT